MGLTDFENSIRVYLENRLREEFPELSVDSGTQVADITVNPMIEVMKPVMNLVNRMELIHDLSNAENMTADELDKIGVGNYGISRGAGEQASGYVYVEMNAEYVGPTQVVIGPITVKNSDDLMYYSTIPTIIRYYEGEEVSIQGTVVTGIAADYFNTSTGKYNFPIFVTAAAEGADYNADAGTITTLVTQYPLLTSVVTNREAFTNGTESETNADYAERLKMSWSSRQLGSMSSYTNYIKSTFNGVYDVLVQGYNDNLMERDKIIIKSGDKYIYKHIGGKIDIYAKGQYLMETTQLAHILNNKFRLEYPYLTFEGYININNVTNKANDDLTCTVTYQYPQSKDGWVDLTIAAGASGVLPADGDEVEIIYQSYIDNTKLETLWFRETMYWNSPRIRLTHQPYYSISSIAVDVTGTLPAQTDMSTTQVKLPSTFSSEDDIFNNHDIDIYVGDTWVTRQISDYDGTNKIATVSAAYSTQPASGGAVVIKDVAVTTTTPYTVARKLPTIESATAPSQSGLPHNYDFKLNPVTGVPIEEYYLGATIYIVSGTGSGQTNLVESMDEENLILSCHSAWTTPPDNTSKYIIVSPTNNQERSSKDTMDIILDTNAVIGTSTSAFTNTNMPKVKYKFDKLIEEIQWDLDVETNRIVTTDVLVRKANPVYVYMGIKLVAKTGQTITTADKLALTALVTGIIDNTNFNSTLKTSDIISAIYKNAALMTKIDYIQLPIIIFSSATIIEGMTEETLLAYTDATHCKSAITFLNADYPVLEMLAIKVVS